jgi:hypothetical protein
MTTLSPAAVRSPRLNLGVYVLVVVLLYIGDLISGGWVLFYGLSLPTANVAVSSLLFWFGAWALCYLGYRRSKSFGIALVIVTIVLTLLIVALVVFMALFFGLTSEE